jgi:large subunit ribosomal protein L2
MPIRSYKPTSPGRRQMTVLTYEEITRTEPERSLLAPLRKKGGRNNQGRLTVRHQGGGHKRRYRIIDFKKNKDGIVARVASIEYDPNRSANIALLNYARRNQNLYHCSPWLQVGQEIINARKCGYRHGQYVKTEEYSCRHPDS